MAFNRNWIANKNIFKPTFILTCVVESASATGDKFKFVGLNRRFLTEHFPILERILRSLETSISGF